MLDQHCWLHLVTVKEEAFSQVTLPGNFTQLAALQVTQHEGALCARNNEALLVDVNLLDVISKHYIASHSRQRSWKELEGQSCGHTYMLVIAAALNANN